MRLMLRRAGLLLLVALTILLSYGVWLMRAHMGLASDRTAVGIEVAGEQWWWRVTYSAPGGGTVTTFASSTLP